MNDAIKERLLKLGGQYTSESIERIARYLDHLCYHCLTLTTRTMGLAEFLNNLLKTPYEDEEQKDKAGPRLIKRRGKFQVECFGYYYYFGQ